MEKASQVFHREKTTRYLLALEDSKDLYSIGKYLTQHLKVAGGYWSLTSLYSLHEDLTQEKKNHLMGWLKTCQNQDGGFGGNTGYDSHITCTHYAVLIAIVFGKLSEIDIQKIAKYISSLQQPNGSFFGDKWGEVDTRFSYCALSCMTLINKIELVDVAKAAQYVLSCRNFDGSFGGIPGAESHGAYVFCSVGTLRLAGYMQSFDKDDLARWLCERQTTKGGFNGRPEKLPDVCYSWWIYSSLCIINRREWIDQKALEQFILNCQDPEDGGISDRPSNTVDVFHTFFGLAALSLLNGKKYNLRQINPIFALPQQIVSKMPHLSKFF